MSNDGVLPSIIKGKPDNLDEVGARFERVSLTKPLFLNSVPKSGTHLIRNIMRMFVPEAEQYHGDYIQIPNLRAHLLPFTSKTPYVSWGHLLFSDESALALQRVRHIVLVRDPYDWVLARTRFYLSDEFKGGLEHIKNGGVTLEQVMNMMIMGIHQKTPSLLDIFSHNAVSWMGAGAVIVRYEDIIRAINDIDSKASEAFFLRLFADCGVDPVPADWRARVLAGSDRKQSRTARENLTVGVDLPKELPEMQKKIVDFTAPGLRALLGYS